MTLKQYQTVAEIIEDVRALRPLGGSAYGHSAAMGFKLTAQDPAHQTAEQILQACDNVLATLLVEKPTMATIYNAHYLIVEKSRSVAATGDLAATRTAIVQRAELFAETSATAMARLSRVGSNMVQAGQTIMMHSYSRSLMAIFEQAAASGKSFSVICTQSQPTLESRHALRQLTEWGIKVTFVLDAAMAVAVPQADFCLVGADSISIDGSIANKVGSYQLALLAHAFGRPFHVATEVMKLQRQTMDGVPVPLEERPGAEILDRAAASDHPDRITVYHPFFDLTPAVLIRSLVTEQGILAPGQIGTAWRQFEQQFEE